MLAKFRVVLARFVVERHLMVSEPSFELRGCKTYIGFGFTASRHLGLVGDPFSEAISFQGAFFLLLIQLHALSAWSCAGFIPPLSVFEEYFHLYL